MDPVLRGPQQRPLAPGVLGRFAFVGMSGAAVYYLLLWSLVELGGMPALRASSLAFAVVVLENYLLHRYWTFDSRIPHRKVLPRFVLMALCSGLVNGAVMGAYLLQGWHYLVAQTLALLVVVTCNFVGTLFIFRGRGLEWRDGLARGAEDATL